MFKECATIFKQTNDAKPIPARAPSPTSVQAPPAPTIVVSLPTTTRRPAYGYLEGQLLSPSVYRSYTPAPNLPRSLLRPSSVRMGTHSPVRTLGRSSVPLFSSPVSPPAVERKIVSTRTNKPASTSTPAAIDITSNSTSPSQGFKLSLPPTSFNAATSTFTSSSTSSTTSRPPAPAVQPSAARMAPRKKKAKRMTAREH
ncbi:hypothetical protein BGX29_003843 [Mortierella sp. GBA35]|nr:hypothetical protein BGX29_003843 [Mortierella sp. GBA35]